MRTMHKGFARIFRTEAFDKLTIEERGVYFTLAVKAHFHPETISWNGKSRQIPSNCYVFSSIKLAKELGIGINRLKRALKGLQNHGLILFETCSSGSLVYLIQIGSGGEGGRSKLDQGVIQIGSGGDPQQITPQAGGRSTMDHIEEKKIKIEEQFLNFDFREKELSAEEIAQRKIELYSQLGIIGKG